MVYAILRRTLAPLIKLIFVKQVSGLENLPKKGPFIIAANHASYCDPVLLGVVLVMHLNRHIHSVAMKPLAKYFIGRWVVGRYFRSVFVNGSISEAIEQLKLGEIVVIFPEGGRTYDGELQKCDGTGTAVLASVSKVPVIPVCIDGTFELWPRQQRFPKFKKIVSFNFGKKIYFRKHKQSKKEMKEFINVLMHCIAKLCKKRYYY